MTRKFDKYFVVLGAGTNGKFAHLNDAEFRAHIVGVLAIAATASIRGCLLVGELEAEPCHVATIAGVKEKDAETCLAKLKAVGVLIRDDDLGCWRVHDWEEVNPPPKTDNTANERQQRRRAKIAAELERVTVEVTAMSRCDDRDDHADVTAPEVEGEEEEQQETANAVSVEPKLDAAREVIDYWRTVTNRPGAKLLPERVRMVKARLSRFTVEEIKLGIDGSQTDGAVDKSGHRFDDLKNICRSDGNLETYIERAAVKPVGLKLLPAIDPDDPAFRRTADRMAAAGYDKPFEAGGTL